jgi:hypothetical protein
VKFRDPWIDPRIMKVRPADAQAYLVSRGWKQLGPAEANPNLLLFDAPEENEEAPLVQVPQRVEKGPEVQWMIDVVTELARYEDRYAGDVLTDILGEATRGPAPAPNGAVVDPAATPR